MEENQGKNEDVELEASNSQKTKQNSIKTSVVKKIWNIFMKMLTIIIAIISIIIVVQRVTNNKQSFFGYRIFRVQTGSMIPKYQVGDVILV